MAPASSSVTGTAAAALSHLSTPLMKRRQNAHLDYAGSSLNPIYHFHHYLEAVLRIHDQAVPSVRKLKGQCCSGLELGKVPRFPWGREESSKPGGVQRGLVSENSVPV